MAKKSVNKKELIEKGNSTLKEFKQFISSNKKYKKFIDNPLFTKKYFPIIVNIKKKQKKLQKTLDIK